ncbi:DUF7660 family protein [Paraflavitalea pollutisoli]|uniref:DUF7660 family protein n=1 Tax=Paraflavitalea pollutisoli TaxID=3034143 RepID=UPI0023EAF5E3|nr:hypothetical protein [Paraflavitalea sp. H1-2-19X]
MNQAPIDLPVALEAVSTKTDFIRFLHLLLKDLQNNPGGWENNSLESYLEAFASWTEDMDGYYDNHNLSRPGNINWKAMANMFMAARIYE